MVKSSGNRVDLDASNSSIPLPNTTTTTTTTKLQAKDESTRKRQYKGVRMRSWGSWVSEIRAPHQKTRIWLGSYSTPEAAARAYDAALLCLKGSSAALNFPTSLPYHPPNTVMSPKSIQRVAAAAANAVTPTTSTLSPATTPPPSSPSSPSDATEGSPSTTTTSSNGCMVNTIEDESWIDFGAFQSPKLMDQTISPLISSWEELDEEGDFELWSFC
ncbi:ethylene-responsive transcription factor ERF014 [Cocos nucifera]|nr:ethylene-responsive transcription factor ERF014 [Cocos nucifera]